MNLPPWNPLGWLDTPRRAFWFITLFFLVLAGCSFLENGLWGHQEKFGCPEPDSPDKSNSGQGNGLAGPSWWADERLWYAVGIMGSTVANAVDTRRQIRRANGSLTRKE